MLKAEIGDFLYIIIFAVLMLLGGLEKVMKAKRQQNMPPRPPQPYDDFGDVESSPGQTPPQTLEEIMRRMMQTTETSGQEKSFYPEEAQSLEVIPDTPYFHYQPVVNPIIDQAEKEAFALGAVDDGIKESENRKFEFDIRQAVIANEILNRKY